MAGNVQTGDSRSYYRQSGSMTVFFCLALLLIGAIICTCLESARTAGLRFMAKAASDSALQSVFADYHEALWEDYHVFFHHEEMEMEKTMEEYLSFYENPGKGLYGTSDYANIWGLKVDHISVNEKRTALSDGGRLFLEQAVEYEKYQIAETVLEELLSHTQWLDEINKIRTFAVTVSNCFEQIQQMSVLYQNVRDCIGAAVQLGIQIQTALEGETPDLKSIYILLEELLEKIEHLRGSAEGYLSGTGTISKLIDKLAKEYGEDQGTVYDQYIGQLRKFTVNGVLGAAVESVNQKVSELGGSLGQVMREIGRLISSENDSFVKDDDEDDVKKQEEAAEDKETTESRETTENKETVGVEDVDGIVEGALSAVKAGVLAMQDLERVLALAEDSGKDDADIGDENLESSGEGQNTDPGREGTSLLETVKQWKNMTILSLVMGAEATQTKADYFPEPTQLPSAMVTEPLKEVTVAEKGLFIFYVTDTFTNVLSDQQKEYAYQQEYIVFGKPDSRSNLTAMAERLLAVREGLNLAFLLTNAKMRTLAGQVATALVGSSGVYPLVLLTQFLILAAWAFAESVADVRSLFDGAAVPLWKTEANWKTTVSGLVKELGDDVILPEGGALDIKLTYDDYLRLFLLINDTQILCLRSMDIIQQEIGSGQSSFRMMDCYGAANLTVQFSSPFRLITLPLIGESEGIGHRIEVISSYKYK